MLLTLDLRGLQDVFYCPICGKEIQESAESFQKREAADPDHVNDYVPFCEHVVLVWHSELSFLTEETESWGNHYDSEKELIEKFQTRIEKEELSNHFIFSLTGLPAGCCGGGMATYSMIFVIAWPEEFVREENKQLQETIAAL